MGPKDTRSYPPTSAATLQSQRLSFLLCSPTILEGPHLCVLPALQPLRFYRGCLS